MILLEADDLKLNRKGGLHEQWGIELLMYTVLGEASSLITVANIPERRLLQIRLHLANNGSSPMKPTLYFNNDQAANYGFIVSNTFGAAAASSNQIGIPLGAGNNPAEGFFGQIDVSNWQTKTKLGYWACVDEDDTTVNATSPQSREGFLKWGNGADLITRIDLTDEVTSRVYEAGSQVYVYSIPVG